MRNLIISVITAFVFSIILHFIFFVGFNEALQKNKLQFSTSNKKSNIKKGFTNIKFVRIKQPVKPAQKKAIKKREPQVEQTKVLKPKKPVIKKNKPIKKDKNVQKQVKKIKIPKKKKEIDLKSLFTIDKAQQKKIKEEEQKFNEQLEEIKSIKKLDPVTQSYIKLYGEQYLTFSQEEKKFIKENISYIGMITQRYLKYPQISIRTRQSGTNVVEFILHPNGDITNLGISDSSHYTALDKNTIHTIKIAYKDYPRPSKPVKIKIYVNYILR